MILFRFPCDVPNLHVSVLADGRDRLVVHPLDAGDLTLDVRGGQRKVLGRRVHAPHDHGAVEAAARKEPAARGPRDAVHLKCWKTHVHKVDVLTPTSKLAKKFLVQRKKFMIAHLCRVESPLARVRLLIGAGIGHGKDGDAPVTVANNHVLVVRGVGQASNLPQ